jgi:nucleotide-binding universal stress UspA family protein
MKSGERVMEREAKRILVALDASAHSLKSLEAAAALAIKEQAELIGLFVEDINLFRTAELPFVREIRLPSASEEQMDPARLKRELRVRAAQICQTFAEIADRAQLRWSFQIVRGNVPSELVTASSSFDFLLLASRSLLLQEALIKRLLEESCCAVSLVH